MLELASESPGMVFRSASSWAHPEMLIQPRKFAFLLDDSDALGRPTLLSSFADGKTEVCLVKDMAYPLLGSACSLGDPDPPSLPPGTCLFIMM